jgi:hypothetical protein
VGFEEEHSTVDPRPRVAEHAIAPNFFRRLGIPLRAGRTFSAEDRDAAIILSQSVADHFRPLRQRS